MTTDDKYVEIDISPKNEKEKKVIEVSLEEEIPDEEEVLDEKPAPKEEPKAEPKNEAPRKPSRAEKRIRELHSRLQESEAEKEEMRKQLLSGTKETKTTTKGALEEQVKMLHAQIRGAIEAGNAEDAVTLQDQLMDVKMQLAGVQHEIKHYETVEAQEKAKPAQKPNAVPDAALDWIEQYPAFKKDELFNAAAIVVNNRMIAEGWDNTTAEFYEELNERLTPRFPEVFGVVDKKDVSSKKDTSNEGDDDEDPDGEDEKDTGTSKSKPVQTMGAPSRTPSKNAPRKGNVVKLTPADVIQAQRWGLSLEQMARRISHSEKNKREDGYTPIFTE